MDYKGVKISFEGIDGSGKTTQVFLVANVLRELGYKVFVAPDNSDASEEGIDGKILSILRKKGDRFFRVGFPATEALLLAARASYLDEIEIKPKLKEGCVVLCDRDVDTFVAYGLPSLRSKHPDESAQKLFEWLLSAISVGRTPPDLTLLFSPDLKRFLPRATVGPKDNKRLETFNDGDRKFMRKVALYYKQLSARFGKRIKVFEVSDKDREEVTEEILSIIKPFLIKKHVPKF